VTVAIEGRRFVAAGSSALGLPFAVALFHELGEDLMRVVIGMPFLGHAAALLEVGPQGVVAHDIVRRVLEHAMAAAWAVFVLDFVDEGEVDHGWW